MSFLKKIGREKYLPKDANALKHLAGLEYTVVARNKGIDAILKEEINGRLVFIRVQREDEIISQTVFALLKATEKKGPCYMIVVSTVSGNEMFQDLSDTTNLIIVPSFLHEFNQAVAHHFTLADYPGNKIRIIP